MDCEQAVALLSARLDHEIQPDDRVALDLHLRDCSACRTTADAIGLQHQELRGAFEPRRQAAAATAEKVNAQLPAPAQPKAKAATPRGRAVRAALVLAAVAAAAAIVLLSRRWTEPPSRPTASDLLKPLAGVNFPPEELTPRPRRRRRQRKSWPSAIRSKRRPAKSAGSRFPTAPCCTSTRTPR